MKRTKRLQTVCGQLSPCDTLADVGCDHGYCTLYALERGLCRRAVISDISRSSLHKAEELLSSYIAEGRVESSLHKAEELLSSYIAEGRVESVCCAGLSQVSRNCDQVLIAGMGGEEIVKILEGSFLPQALVLQPMKNTEKVRAFLLEKGYCLVRDFLFYDGPKHYDLLRAERGAPPRAYGSLELEFGYDNIHAPLPDFDRFLRGEIENARGRLEKAAAGRAALQERLRRLEEALHAAFGTL